MTWHRVGSGDAAQQPPGGWEGPEPAQRGSPKPEGSELARAEPEGVSPETAREARDARRGPGQGPPWGRRGTLRGCSRKDTRGTGQLDDNGGTFLAHPGGSEVGPHRATGQPGLVSGVQAAFHAPRPPGEEGGTVRGPGEGDLGAATSAAAWVSGEARQLGAALHL